MLVLWSIAASAAIPVVHDGGIPTEVVAAVSARTGLPQSELTAEALDRLLQTPPQVFGQAVLRRCGENPTGAARMPEVHAELARAEASFAQQDLLAAMDHLDLAVAVLGCLDAIVESGPASRVFRLRAAVRLAEGNVEGARGELRTALAFDMGLEWADGMPSAGAALLDQERLTAASRTLRVFPAASTSGPWIDGRVAGALTVVAPGLHLAQYGARGGMRSAWLVVGGDAALVVPTSFRRPIVERMDDPAARPQIEALLSAAIPEFHAAYVVHGGGLWLVSRDEEQLSTTEIPAAVPVVTEPPREERNE